MRVHHLNNVNQAIQLLEYCKVSLQSKIFFQFRSTAVDVLLFNMDISSMTLARRCAVLHECCDRDPLNPVCYSTCTQSHLN
jgi:hypothetical protein